MTSKVTAAAILGAGAYSASSAIHAFVIPGQAASQQTQVQQQPQKVRRLRAQENPADESHSASAALAAGAFGVVAVSAAAGRKRGQRVSNMASSATAVATNVDTDCVNAIRFLAVDAINKSKSGHPGAPMGQAPIGYVLFAEEMNFNPADPAWINRDRFVLSSGHGCMLQYALLHLTGYSSVSMDDIKQFRQWGSKTPGHPENFETAGIEVTTGPLGMGISNAVGLAAAEAHNAAVYNKPGLPLIDHYTYCIMGDGCMQEGISHESCAYAGHLGLGKLIAFWDDNGITIDGHTELSFTENVAMRFEAYGWQVLTVEDGNTDVNAIRKAIADAKACTDKPTLIRVKTIIGYGSPNKADSHDAHGAPLGADEAKATRDQLGWKYGEFEVPNSVYDVFKARGTAGAKTQETWNKVWTDYQQKEPALAKQFQRIVVDKKTSRRVRSGSAESNPGRPGQGNPTLVSGLPQCYCKHHARIGWWLCGSCPVQHDTHEVQWRFLEGLL